MTEPADIMRKKANAAIATFLDTPEGKWLVALWSENYHVLTALPTHENDRALTDYERGVVEGARGFLLEEIFGARAYHIEDLYRLRAEAARIGQGKQEKFAETG